MTEQDVSEVNLIIENLSSEFHYGSHWSPLGVKNVILKGESVGRFEGDQLQSFILASDAIDAIEIELVATDSKLQGRGYMKELLKFFIEDCVKPIWLEVHEKNAPALAVYESLDLVNTGRRDNYYSDGGAALLMSTAV